MWITCEQFWASEISTCISLLAVIAPILTDLQLRYVTGHWFWPPNLSWANVSFTTTQTCSFKIYIMQTLMLQLWNSLFITVQAWAATSSETHGAGPAHNGTLFIAVKPHWIQVFMASRNKNKQKRGQGRAVTLRAFLGATNVPTSCSLLPFSGRKAACP